SQKLPNSPTWGLGGDLHPIVLASHYAGTKRPASIQQDIVDCRSSRSAPGYHPPALRLSNQTAIRPYSLLFGFTNKHIPYNDQSDSDCVAVMEVTAGSKATEVMKSSANRDLLGRTGLVHKTVEAPLRGLLNSGPGHGMSQVSASSSLCVEVSSQLHPRSYLPLLAHKKSPHIFQYFWHGNNTRPSADSSSLPTDSILRWHSLGWRHPWTANITCGSVSIPAQLPLSARCLSRPVTSRPVSSVLALCATKIEG
ncbi:hypothetical protein GE21DRAFT_1349397, partial [Neurospora crassa]